MIDINQLPPPPPAIIQFANENGYNKVTPNRWCNSHKYKGYTVFDVRAPHSHTYILWKDNEIRFATPEEWEEIWSAIF